MAGQTLEERFRDLEGFTSRHTQREREQCAAAIALNHKAIDQYTRLRDGLD